MPARRGWRANRLFFGGFPRVLLGVQEGEQFVAFFCSCFRAASLLVVHRVVSGKLLDCPQFSWILQPRRCSQPVPGRHHLLRFVRDRVQATRRAGGYQHCTEQIAAMQSPTS